MSRMHAGEDVAHARMGGAHERESGAVGETMSCDPETAVRASHAASESEQAGSESAEAPIPSVPADIIRIELPTPYAVGSVNVYVVRGESPTLIDVGPRTKEGERALLAGLAAAGLALRDIDQVVITHPHVDHHGLLERVLELNPRIQVAAHVQAQREFGRDREERVGFYERLFASSGMPAAMRAAVTSGLRAMFALEPQVDVHRWLHDGDLLSMGGGTWRVLHTPGHSSSLVCLYREATRTLISSDHVLPDVSSNAIIEPPPAGAAERGHSLIRYIDALRKVAQLPVNVALPGHGAPFTGVAELVRQRISMHERRLDDIERALPAEGATVFELATRMFAPRDGDTLTLAMSEVQGHLDLLQARERVVAEEQAVVIVYRPVTTPG